MSTYSNAELIKSLQDRRHIEVARLPDEYRERPFKKGRRFHSLVPLGHLGGFFEYQFRYVGLAFPLEMGEALLAYPEAILRRRINECLKAAA